MGVRMGGENVVGNPLLELGGIRVTVGRRPKPKAMEKVGGLLREDLIMPGAEPGAEPDAEPATPGISFWG